MMNIQNLDDLPGLLRTIAPELYTEHSTKKGNGLLHQTEVEMLREAMLRFNGNKTKVADYLGMSQTTLWRRLKSIKNL